METLRVWGIGTARTLRAHWVLAELGLRYEARPVLPRTPAMDEPEFRRVSPRHKVPILEDGDLVIGESGAIVLHLADRHRDRVVLTPEFGTPGRSVLHDLLLFTLVELDAVLYVIRRHEGLSSEYGASPVAAAAARAYVARQLAEIERRLADGRPHLLGEDFGAADLVLVTCLQWAQAVGVELPEIVLAYVARIAERPAARAARSANFPPEAIAWMKAGAGAPASRSNHE